MRKKENDAVKNRVKMQMYVKAARIISWSLNEMNNGKQT